MQAVTVVLGAVLVAQTETPREAPYAPRIEEVVVTAEKLNRTLEETITSVTVFTGAELEDRSVEDLYDLVLRTPNVSQSFGEKGFSIRGIDQRFGAGSGLLVNVVVDGAPLPNNQSTFFGPYSAWDLGQVEVLRGPQGTTQGRNAIGGAIIVNTADARFDAFEGRLRLAGGELGTHQAAAAVNVPLTDELAFRLAVEDRATDGWVENPTRGGEDYDPREFRNGRAKLRWAPTDRLELRYTLSYTDSTGGEDQIDVSLFPGQRVNVADAAAFEGSEHLINTLQVDYDFAENWSLYAATSFYDHDYQRIEDLDNTPVPLSVLERTQEDDSLIQEVRFNYDAGGRLRGVFGGFYGNFDSDSVDTFSVPIVFLGIDPAQLAALGIDPTTPIFQDRTFVTGEENVALFGEVEYDLTERWSLIAGARYDDEARDFSGLTRTSVAIDLPFPLPPDEVIETSANYDAFLPKLGVRYRWGDDTTLGFAAQRAYRAGGTGVAVVSGEQNEFEPEYAWNYELALRTELGRGNHFLAANLFHTDWTDQVVQRISDFGIANGIPLDTVPDNAGESSLRGLELQLDSLWTQSFSTFASLGLLETEFDRYEVVNAEFSGNEFPFAPAATFTGGFTYEHPAGWVIRADASWSDEFFGTEQNDPARVTFEPIVGPEGDVVGQRETCVVEPCNDPATLIDSFWVVNLKAGYRAEDWSLFLFARNLLDEDYLAQRFQVSRNFVTGEPFQGGRSAEPRVLGLEFNWSFGG